MSFPRLVRLILPLALGLPLLTGACVAPAAVTAASYGADGVSVVETGKTGADHLASMVSKKDCAAWRTIRNQDICRPREAGQDPYDVNYNEPFRQVGEGGVEYTPPPHAAPDAPPTSWDAAAYAAPGTRSSTPAAAVATDQPPQAVAASTDRPARTNTAPASAKAKKHTAGRSTAGKHKPLKKKPAPDQAAPAP